MYNRFVYSTARYGFATYCYVTRYLYSATYSLLRAVVVASFLKGTLRPTTLWFARFIRFYAPEYRCGAFLFSRCMHPIGISVHTFGRSLREEFFTFWLLFSAGRTVCSERCMPAVRGLCWAPPNRSHTFDYGFCPRSKPSYKRLSGYFATKRSRSFARK